MRAHNRVEVGTTRVRTRHKRGGERRAWVKVAEPNQWKLRAHVVWEKANGPVPPGLTIHHRDEDSLNDVLENLECLTKADHLRKHIAEYHKTSVPKLNALRRKLRWSTKSATKRVGRHPANCTCGVHS